VVDHLAFRPEHRVQRRAPISGVLFGQRVQARPQGRVIPPLEGAPGGRPAEASEPTSPVFADAATFEVFDGLAPLRGRHHFPSTSSLSAALSSSA